MGFIGPANHRQDRGAEPRRQPCVDFPVTRATRLHSRLNALRYFFRAPATQLPRSGAGKQGRPVYGRGFRLGPAFHFLRTLQICRTKPSTYRKQATKQRRSALPLPPGVRAGINALRLERRRQAVAQNRGLRRSVLHLISPCTSTWRDVSCSGRSARGIECRKNRWTCRRERLTC